MLTLERIWEKFGIDFVSIIACRVFRVDVNNGSWFIPRVYVGGIVRHVFHGSVSGRGVGVFVKIIFGVSQFVMLLV